MTNSWVDLDNSTMFFVIGANPAENHPASIAHLNHARFDLSNRGRNAGLIVVDPRQTRTARLTGVPYDASNPNDMRKHDRYVRIRPGTNIAFVNGVMKAIIDWMYANPTDPKAVNFFAWHNGTASSSLANRSFIADDGSTVTVSNWPKYCDSRFLVNSNGDDYQRETRTVGTKTISNFPKLAATIDDPDCVFQKLRQHLASYDTATVADICGCTEADILAVRDAWIDNSRFASSDFGAATATPEAAGYRAAVILYAMGATQFTSGSQGIRTYAMIQTLMGNMGRIGGGIDALRGIHNVQGSTDMGVLFDLIPGYSGNPGVGQTYPDYSNKLFGNRVLQTDPNRPTSKSAYAAGDLGLQQRGFYNMTREWFGDRNVTQQTDIDKLWELWPKGNGYQHIEAFRKMIDGTVKAAVVWGQNPAVTEPNQSKVRQGLENLDLLVVVDMFATETAQCSRKPGGVTYLLPACSHVEEAGSVTNSGRWIQWRDRARPPKGNSKADLELLLRFAKALNTAGAFSHIKQQWATMSSVSSLHNGGSGADPWSMLYAKYGWDGTGDFETVSGLDYEGNTLVGSEYVAEQIFKEIASPLDGYSASGAPNGFVKGHMGTVWIYSGLNTTHGGAYNPDQTGNVHPAVFEDGLASGTAVQWEIANRAKSRKGDPKYRGLSLQYPRYGWAWLLNRRIMYNLGELAGDVSDNFVTPTYLSRLFVINTNTLADWSLVYRAFSTLSDKPSVPVGGTSKHSIYAGRFPAHTEPYESPRPDLVAAWGYNTANGASLIFSDTPRGTVDQYPLVLTTFRCVEHFQGGPITRNNPWNVEAEPEPWIEINSVDAIKYGIKDGDYVNVITARSNSTTDEEGRCADGAIAPAPGWAKGFKARVGVGTLANQRVAPGVVAIPWHWGERGLGTGSRANDLTIDAWDANARITEYKVCLCRIEKA